MHTLFGISLVLYLLKLSAGQGFWKNYFSLPPSFKYFVKGKDETFRSHEKDHRKAYHNYLKDKLQEHFNNL